MNHNDRYPLLGIHPPEQSQPVWLCWLIAIVVTCGPTIALLAFVFWILQPRIAELTRLVP